jgi:hypothetical protein
VQAVLQRNLIERCPAADLFGREGRAWLAQQPLPADERQAVSALLRQLDFHAQELRLIDQELARVAMRCEDTKRLMTIPGVDVTVAMSITAAARSPPPAAMASQHPETAVELPLDDVQRHTLTGQLERMRVAQLVRGEAPADAGGRGEPAGLGTNAGA